MTATSPGPSGSATPRSGATQAAPRTLLCAFQALDRAIITPLFLLAFLGAFAFTGLAAGLSLGRGARLPLPWLVAALALYLAVLVITFRVNVPLNDTLKEGCGAD